MADYKNFCDNKLIQLIKQSDHSAYTEIYKRYFYLLFVHAYKKLRDEEQAKDVIQDLFTTLWFKRTHDLPESNLAGYLFTAVRNKIFDLFAHQQVQTKYVESFQTYFSERIAPSADYQVRENDLKTYIEKAIASLPPKMKRIFELSRNEYLSHKEIAERLGTSENNVSTQMTSALRILKTKLSAIAFIWILLNSR